MQIKGFKDTIAWYDANAKSYADVSEGSANIEFLDTFSSLLPKQAHVLDAGCAAGRDTRLLADRQLDVIGLDISKGLLAEAKKRHPDLEFVEGSFLQLPFSDNTFDGVWAHASLVHLETIADVEKTISEFFRVLKVGGILHILVKAQTGDEKTAIVKDKLSNHERFFQYYTIPEIEMLLQKNNFQIINTYQYNEVEKNPNGRPEVDWIVVFAKKV